MDEDTRAAFGRIDRYFELSQLQVTELRLSFEQLRAFTEGQISELRSEVRANSEGLQANSEELQALRSELRGFRDWAETSFASVRSEVKEVRSWAETRFSEIIDRDRFG